MANAWVSLLLLVITVVSVSAIKKTDTAVRYIHTAFAGNYSSLVIGWYTEDATASSTVVYGLSANALSLTANGSANYWKKGYGFNHFVTLKGLQPDTKYYYKCGDAAGGFSAILSVKTAPVEAKPFTVGICGDMGIDNSANTVAGMIKNVNAGNYDWIYHVGDMAYADDHVFSFQETWNTWAQSVSPITEKIPYMVVPGNHEHSSYDPFLLRATWNFAVYNKRFFMPGGNSKSKSMYYSFDYGQVHFIGMSTETSFPDAPYGSADDFGDEIAWITADLQEANLPENRKVRPWIVLIGHRPIYSSAVDYSKDGVPINSLEGPSNSATLQKLFEDMFHKYKVNVMFTGHVHSYERNHPAYQNKVAGTNEKPEAPIGIVIGNAGNMEGKSSFIPEQPVWSAYRFAEDYGYGELSVINGTVMEWSFFSASDAKLRDHVYIYNYAV